MDLLLVFLAYIGLFSTMAVVFAVLLHSVQVREDATLLEMLIRWLDLEADDA